LNLPHALQNGFRGSAADCPLLNPNRIFYFLNFTGEVELPLVFASVSSEQMVSETLGVSRNLDLLPLVF